MVISSEFLRYRVSFFGRNEAETPATPSTPRLNRMNWEVIFHAGLATGTVLLFAAIGEIFAERPAYLI